MKTYQKPLLRIMIVIWFCFIAGIIILPLLFVFTSTFKDTLDYLKDPVGLPRKWSLENYRLIFNGFKVQTYFLNSILVAAASHIISFFVSVLASYAFAKLNFRGKRTIYTACIALIMIPYIVTLIPQYIMYSKFGLIDNLLSLIISYAVSTIPYTVYFLTVNFKKIPNEMIEAAKTDGASLLKVIWFVVLPASKAAVITISIINFITYWNELVLASLFINSDSHRTLTLFVAIMGTQFLSNMPLILTGLTLLTIPVLIIYLFFEKYIEDSITMGALQ